MNVPDHGYSILSQRKNTILVFSRNLVNCQIINPWQSVGLKESSSSCCITISVLFTSKQLCKPFISDIYDSQNAEDVVVTEASEADNDKAMSVI